MNQVLAIEEIINSLQNIIEDNSYSRDFTIDSIKKIITELKNLNNQEINYKIVVDSLDDSIFITDNKGKVIYVNPAHKNNTGILPQEVLGRTVSDIVNEGKLFSGGATLEVLETGKRAFRLATVLKSGSPEVGYTIGVPIFKESGELEQVVVSSRPILSLQALQDDFESFLEEATVLKNSIEKIRILPNSDTSSLKSNKLIGCSSQAQAVYNIIQKSAPTDATVLITGESGVGKEIVADEIYRLSLRKDYTFIKVNCASIPNSLLESELFGYEKGAFSGANSNGKPGIFEIANYGTLLLDEIGDMPMELQVKLLRAIQNREITRVGGTKPIKLNIRIIASTNSNLKEKIADRTFRQDLYYRLNVIPIHIPPLRDRPQDLESLCKHFVSLYTQKHQREFTLTKEHINIMKKHTWPGNVRELENVIEYMTVCSSGYTDLDKEMLKSLLGITEESQFVPVGTLSQAVEKYEKGLIEDILKHSKNLRDAADQLGVNVSTISRKVKQYNIQYHNTSESVKEIL